MFRCIYENSFAFFVNSTNSKFLVLLYCANGQHVHSDKVKVYQYSQVSCFTYLEIVSLAGAPINL